MTERAPFLLTLGAELRRHGLLGTPTTRACCAARAATAGDAILGDVHRIAGPRTAARALATRRGDGYADSYRYVAGYGRLMTDFLVAPVVLDARDREQVARLGGLANVLVSHFDELVDEGWPRAFLLPRWALGLATGAPGRTALRAGVHPFPAPTRMVVRLVASYFESVAALPHARTHTAARAALGRAIRTMYEEEGRTPREWRRTRGSASLQRKTALPLVVLGLAAWLAARECPAASFARHRRWLVRVGKFIRWIDDAADLGADERTGASNLVAAARRRADDAALAAAIARRGRRVVDEWHALTEECGASGVRTLETVLAAWVGVGDGGD